jgi:hypothetical protein
MEREREKWREREREREKENFPKSFPKIQQILFKSRVKRHRNLN